jgi:hypothetical protein
MQIHGAAARRISELPDGAGLSRGLGWFSVGLGIAELAAPRVLARAIGIDHRGRTGERLEWRTVRGSKLPNRGSVTFRPVLGGSATEVCVELQVGTRIGAAIADLFAGPKLEGDLRRLKQVLETGEVVRSDASIHRGPHAARPSAEQGGKP